MTTQPPAPDWYPDPSGKPGLMYWDGEQWHTHIPDISSPADRPAAEPISTTPRPHRRTALIAALVVAVAVLAGMVGITSYLLQRHSHASQTPTAQPAPPSSGVVPSATPPSAEVPGLAPFVGQWYAHASRLTINADGSGRLMYSDINACSGPCSFADAPTGTADFTLTSVSGGTATGSVTATSNTNNDTVGGPVTIKLVTGIGYPFTGSPASVSGNNGVVLAVSMGKMQGWNYCNDTTHNYCGGG